MNTDAFLNSLDAASLVIKALSGQGVTVKAVTLTGAKPVIRIERCGMCDTMIHEGRATFLEFGCDVSGRYRQGHFYTNGCKVVWSESMH
ncbi:hypothetical protein GM30_06610 [Trabulsiella odontotermitis]|nr:hypothetical protein GM30_06610 [Trabulsiella odontotermitis]